jgi:hypothetical protein
VQSGGLNQISSRVIFQPWSWKADFLFSSLSDLIYHKWLNLSAVQLTQSHKKANNLLELFSNVPLNHFDPHPRRLPPHTGGQRESQTGKQHAAVTHAVDVRTLMFTTTSPSAVASASTTVARQSPRTRSLWSDR